MGLSNMKKIVVTDCKDFGEITSIEGRKVVGCVGEENMDADDGYHTFTELYEHRITLFIALCKSVQGNADMIWERERDTSTSRGMKQPTYVWRSKLHSDGTMFDGQFIMGIGIKPGEQITYHLPVEKWSLTDFAETLDKAPEFDGHTPSDVLNNLMKL